MPMVEQPHHWMGEDRCTKTVYQCTSLGATMQQEVFKARDHPLVLVGEIKDNTVKLDKAIETPTHLVMLTKNMM